MKIEPVITEKSLEKAKKGEYTFKVENSLTKHQAKKLIESTFTVHVTRIRSANQKSRQVLTIMRRKKRIKPFKKVIVKLAEKEKIEIFETKK